MNNVSNSFLVAILMIFLLSIEMKIFGSLFPWVGLKAIIAFPMIYIICLAIIISGVVLTKKIKLQSQIVVWVTIFLLNSLIAAHLYPQEFRPTVYKQIKFSINVIKNYDRIVKEDIELFRESEYNPYDKSVPDDKERYIAALHKFRNEINRDGSVFIYGEKDKPILENTNIENHLETGQEKLLWWALEKFKNK